MHGNVRISDDFLTFLEAAWFLIQILDRYAAVRCTCRNCLNAQRASAQLLLLQSMDQGDVMTASCICPHLNPWWDVTSKVSQIFAIFAMHTLTDFNAPAQPEVSQGGHTAWHPQQHHLASTINSSKLDSKVSAKNFYGKNVTNCASKCFCFFLACLCWSKVPKPSKAKLRSSHPVAQWQAPAPLVSTHRFWEKHERNTVFSKRKRQKTNQSI